jgi:hypothetical protein
MHTSSYKYKKLNDKEWLYQKYIVEEMGTRKIAEIAGAKGPNSARQALLRANIPLRTISDGLTTRNHHDDFCLDEDVISGGLLGDGYMLAYNRFSDLSYPYFAKKNLHRDHVEYVASKLFPKSFTTRVRIEHGINPFNGRPTTYHKITTLARKELLSYYRKWYSPTNDFHKVVPTDLKMNKEILLHWFLDDGCTIFIHNKSLIEAKFCAMGFQRDEQEFLVDLIKSTFGLAFTIRKADSGSKTDIWAPSSQYNNLIEILGECPIKSMEYKWKMTQS